MRKGDWTLISTKNSKNFVRLLITKSENDMKTCKIHDICG